MSSINWDGTIEDSTSQLLLPDLLDRQIARHWNGSYTTTDEPPVKLDTWTVWAWAFPEDDSVNIGGQIDILTCGRGFPTNIDIQMYTHWNGVKWEVGARIVDNTQGIGTVGHYHEEYCIPDRASIRVLIDLRDGFSKYPGYYNRGQSNGAQVIQLFGTRDPAGEENGNSGFFAVFNSGTFHIVFGRKLDISSSTTGILLVENDGSTVTWDPQLHDSVRISSLAIAQVANQGEFLTRDEAHRLYTQV